MMMMMMMMICGNRIPREHTKATGTPQIPGTLAGYPENTQRQQGPPRYQAPWQDTPRTHKGNRDPPDTRHPGRIPREHTKATGTPQIPGTLAGYPENTQRQQGPRRYQALW